MKLYIKTLSAMMLWFCGSVFAATPGTLHHSGSIHTAGTLGVEKSLTADLSVIYSIYDDSDSLLWVESQTVSVVNGKFSTLLGGLTPIPLETFSGYEGLELSVEVEGEELLPRLSLGTVPYAIHSDTADDVVGAINPLSVSINGSEVINDSGEWVGSATGLNGPEGPEGPQGPKGDIGVTGLPGVKGDMGAQGPQGPKGDVGAIGLPGIKGDTGGIGLQGPKGDVGAIGLPGIKGDTGGIGPQGPKGDVGAIGLPGIKGDTGGVGSQGPQGVKGDVGATGLPGAKGDTGTGVQGPQGIQGPQGTVGAGGAKGDKGDAGVAGPAGPAGSGGYFSLIPTLNWSGGSASLSSLNLALLQLSAASAGTLVSSKGYFFNLQSEKIDHNTVYYTSNNCSGTGYVTASNAARGAVFEIGEDSSLVYVAKNATSIASISYQSKRYQSSTQPACRVYSPATLRDEKLFPVITNNTSVTGISLTADTLYSISFE